MENVVCVGATNNKGELYYLSGYGKNDMVYAPGEDVLGLLPEEDVIFSSGTSFATAYVTGVAALVKSSNITLTPTDVANILKESKRDSSNYPLIDAKKAITKSKTYTN